MIGKYVTCLNLFLLIHKRRFNTF